MMKVDIKSFSEDDQFVNAIVSSATLRVVQQSQRTSVAGQNHRMSADDTLDIIKVVVVGDSGVGKTCLMLRFVKDEFVSSTRATIGMDFCTRQLAINSLNTAESSTVQRLTVQVWDTAGQEQYQSLTATYYRKAGGVMIVYDSNSRASFESLDKWLQARALLFSASALPRARVCAPVSFHARPPLCASQQVEDNAEEDIVKMIVATKLEGDVAVSAEEGKAYADAHGCLFGKTSAMTGDGVLRAFHDLSAKVLTSQEVVDEKREGLWLNAPQPATPKRSGGCC